MQPTKPVWMAGQCCHDSGADSAHHQQISVCCSSRAPSLSTAGQALPAWYLPQAKGSIVLLPQICMPMLSAGSQDWVESRGGSAQPCVQPSYAACSQHACWHAASTQALLHTCQHWLAACSKHSGFAAHLSEEMRLLRPACQASQTCHVESDAEGQAPGRPKLWTCVSISPRPGECAVTACTAA